MANSENNLKKDLGIISSLAMVVGMVIGSGVYVKPSLVFAQAGGATMGLTAWLLGGIITMTAGLTLAELGVLFPETGGLYVYINEIYGKLCSFLFGWMQTLIYGPAIIGALGGYFASLAVPFLGEYFGIGEEAKIPIAITVIVFLAVINSIGTKYGGIIQSIATIAKLIPIFAIAIFGIIKGNGSALSAIPSTTHAAGMGAAILATLWAYDGWASVSFMAGEMKNPAKVLPRAIIGGLLLVIIAYLSINFALLKLMPVETIVGYSESQASSEAAKILFGETGMKLVSVGILISIFGALNGNILTLPRVPYAMACRGQFPFAGVFSKVHSSFGTPIYATTLQVVVAISLLLAKMDADRLTDWAMFSMFIFYTLCFTGVFIARSKFADRVRTYKVPLYPIVPVIAIIGSLYILGSTLINSNTDCAISLGITALGIPVFYMLKTGK